MSETEYDTENLRLFKLVNGEDILGTYVDKDTHYQVSFPYRVVYGSSANGYTMYLIKFLSYCLNTDCIDIDKKHCILCCRVGEDMCKYYFESVIDTESKNSENVLKH